MLGSALTTVQLLHASCHLMQEFLGSLSQPMWIFTNTSEVTPSKYNNKRSLTLVPICVLLAKGGGGLLASIGLVTDTDDIAVD